MEKNAILNDTIKQYLEIAVMASLLGCFYTFANNCKIL